MSNVHVCDTQIENYIVPFINGIKIELIMVLGNEVSYQPFGCIL